MTRIAISEGTVLVVAHGVIMPSVVGQLGASAGGQLQALGLSVQVPPYRTPPELQHVGLVESQTPPPGTVVVSGGHATIRVYGPPAAVASDRRVNQAGAPTRSGPRHGAGSLGLVTNGAERTRWKIRGDRTVDENPRIRLSVASLELADGTVFDQYVMRLPRCAMTVVLDEAAERVLLIWRHRFIIDRWMWELPGGYIDPGEDGIAAAAREVEEETGYRPRSIEHVLTFQPMAGSADSAHELYLARGADRVGAPLADEAEEVRWIPLADLPGLIAAGEILGAATIIGAQHALLAADTSLR